jgi:molecular chaperone DnaK
LSEEEIEKMVKEAELHAEEDKKRKDLVNSKNQLDNLVYQTEKLVNENKDKLPAEEVTKAEEATKAAKETLAKEGASADDYKGEVERLTNISHALSTALYEKQKAEGGGDQAADAGADAPNDAKSSGKDDVIDADFKDVN